MEWASMEWVAGRKRDEREEKLRQNGEKKRGERRVFDGQLATHYRDEIKEEETHPQPLHLQQRFR